MCDGVITEAVRQYFLLRLSFILALICFVKDILLRFENKITDVQVPRHACRCVSTFCRVYLGISASVCKSFFLCGYFNPEKILLDNEKT